MKYIAKEIPENVNVSKINPLKEFFILLGGLFGILLLIYFSLGYAFDRLIAKMPDQLEAFFSKTFEQTYAVREAPTAEEKRLQDILDQLQAVEQTGLRPCRVHVVKEPTVNAVAIPGGNILVFSGLLKEVKSENELSMILAHELGHFAHHDHLRALGRGAILAFCSVLLFGADSSLTDFLMNALMTTDLKHSRRQEIDADAFALDLLNQRYGHVGGAADFFERLEQKEKMPHFFAFFSTHPHHKDRLVLLRQRIKEKHYELKETAGLNLAVAGSGQ